MKPWNSLGMKFMIVGCVLVLRRGFNAFLNRKATAAVTAKGVGKREVATGKTVSHTLCMQSNPINDPSSNTSDDSQEPEYDSLFEDC